MPVTMHDGSRILLRKLDPAYDPTDRGAAFNYLRDKLAQGEYVTGLIYIDEKQRRLPRQSTGRRRHADESAAVREADAGHEGAGEDHVEVQVVGRFVCGRADWIRMRICC